MPTPTPQLPVCGYDALTTLVNCFAQPGDIQTALSTVTAVAVDLIAAAHCADVIVVDQPGHTRSIAVSNRAAPDITAVQHRYRQGPGLDAAAGQVMVLSPDLRDEPRWPQFCMAATAAGIHTVLSYPLPSHRRRPTHAAALTFYGRDPHGFDDAGVHALAGVLAAHAAIAFIACDRETEFRSALASRDVIGQAKGMIMERFSVDAARAFELLTKLSQSSNTRLNKVATALLAATPPHDEPQPRRPRHV